MPYDYGHMPKLNANILPLALQELLPMELQYRCTFFSGIKKERLFAQGKKPEQIFYVISVRGQVLQ